MGGRNVSEANYTASSGSLILTLKGSYLNTLAPGHHKVTVLFEDGKVETDLKIVAAPEVPKTGDGASLGFWLALMLLGLFGIGFAVTRAARKK